MNGVSRSISQSIVYVQSASEIWSHIEKRSALSNGSRKYRLIKDVYALKLDGNSVSDYYTAMRSLWLELEAMNDFPKITMVTTEITNFLAALSKQQEHS